MNEVDGTTRWWAVTTKTYITPNGPVDVSEQQC